MGIKATSVATVVIVIVAALSSSCGDVTAEDDPFVVQSDGSDAGVDTASGEPDASADPDVTQADADSSLPDIGPDLPPADTWSNFAADFFTQWCVGCHEMGNANRDYTTIDDVIRDADRIRCGVAPATLANCGSSPFPMQFPATGSPTEEERNRLVAWIDDGLAP